jgi:hypothetical protein
MKRLILALAFVAPLTGCMSRYGITRPIRQETHLNGMIPSFAFGSPRAAGWDQPSRPVPNIIVDTDHMPEWYAEGE